MTARVPVPREAAEVPNLDALARFSAPTREWFRTSFSGPTSAQAGAWAAIATGSHALVVAPTGSGKTLSAFLWALDRLTSRPVDPEAAPLTRVLYISPLKALGVDVERNLRSPLAGIEHAGTRLGVPTAPVTVGVRSGDTPAPERRRLLKTPPDVLITTPESLFLMLTSAARESLRGVDTVIIDEIHAVAGTKRGAHLALSLERLDDLLETPTQRIGLSATVSPREEVARFLGGAKPVTIVAPVSTKRFDLRVVVPVPDLTELPERAPSEGQDADRPGSLWPFIEEEILDRVLEYRSSIIFVNSRRLAERLTAHLNEDYARRLGHVDETERTRPPAEMIAGSGSSGAVPVDAPVLARAHHGSVAKEQRAQIEEDLKTGVLRCVVATSSLELGIDMGEVDLVVQVESPPSVASGLQRVGRAGHQVGEISRGIMVPKHRGDLLGTAVVAERMLAGQIESMRVLTNPLDILAQQTVAVSALDTVSVTDWFDTVRRSAPFAALPRSAFDATLDLVAGRYPSEEFAELRPRVVWDRQADTLTGRPGAQRLAVTSGGTIPDRGLFAVYLVGGEEGKTGSRVGELDEEMVYESRVGDVFALGTSSWKIQEITHDRVLVTPAFGEPGRLPFWKGDGIGRPAELGAAMGRYVREIGALDEPALRERTATGGLNENASHNLFQYLADQKLATGALPTDRTLVLERGHDELGDWRLLLHSPFGMQIHAPWALAIGARLRERFGIDSATVASDDGIIVRLPETDTAPPGAELFLFDADELEQLVTEEVGGSALFASRFRENAARALLLPNYRPGKRAPLWQQRQRSAQLLDVARRYPTFPILHETVREVLQDVYDVPALLALARALAARSVRITETDSETPSPFAANLLFGYVGALMYEGDSPLAERKAAALSLDPGLLSELLGQVEMRELLDPAILEQTEAELQRLVPSRRLRGIEGVADLLRSFGPVSAEQLALRLRPEGVVGDAPADEPHAEIADVAAHLSALEHARRAVPIGDRWIAVEDAGRVRDALGTPLPPGLPSVFTESVPDPLGDLVARFARTRGPLRTVDLAAHLGLGVAVVTGALARLADARRVVRGEFLPETGGDPRSPQELAEWCDAEVLRRIRIRSLAALRHEVEPVSTATYARFLPEWQHIISTTEAPTTSARSGGGFVAGSSPTRASGPRRVGGLSGVEGVLEALDQLAGVYLPASSWETLILPQRVRDYTPAMLDQLTAAGEVVWSGRGTLPGSDGWLALHPADLAPATLADPEALETTPAQDALIAALGAGGGFFFRQLAQQCEGFSDAELTTALWELVWAGTVAGDTLAPMRAHLRGSGAHRAVRTAPRARMHRARPARAGSLFGSAATEVPTVAGRWALLPRQPMETTARLATLTDLQLGRYGVLTRGSVMAEGTPGGFALAYRILARMEDAGQVRRGYFIDGLGGAQFAFGGTVDRLRDAQIAEEDTARTPRTVSLAATDPANPYGAALPWPEKVVLARDGAVPIENKHRPGRKAGGLVTLVDGDLVLYMERGGKTLLAFSADPDTLRLALVSLGDLVRSGRVEKLTVEKVNGEFALSTPTAMLLRDAGFTETPKGLRIRHA